MAAETGNIFPTTNSGFVTMKSSVKVSASDSDSDDQPEMARFNAIRAIILFPGVGHCRNCLDTAIELTVVKSPDLLMEFRSYLSQFQILRFPVLAATLLFAVIGRYRSRLDTLSSSSP